MPTLKSRNKGVIVNIIGAAGERFNYDYITGSTGNAALMAFTKSLGGKSLHYGVRVVGINPGPVATDRHVYLMKTRAKNELGDENRYAELMKDFPLGRAAKPREIADLSGIRSFRLHQRRDYYDRRRALGSSLARCRLIRSPQYPGTVLYRGNARAVREFFAGVSRTKGVMGIPRCSEVRSHSL